MRNALVDTLSDAFDRQHDSSLSDGFREPQSNPQTYQQRYVEDAADGLVFGIVFGVAHARALICRAR